MHFAAWLSVGESVKDPIAYYENNVGGTLAVLGRWSRPASRTSSSRPPPPPSATRSRPRSTESHPQRPINAYGETKLAIERALPHFERAYGVRSVALRYFNAAGADPDGALGEDHHPEIHVIPRAIDAALGRDAFADLRRRLPDAGRHLPARLRPRGGPGVGAPAGARIAARGRGVGGLQSRQRPPDLGPRGGQRRRAGDRARRCRSRPARAGRAIPGCSSRRAGRSARRSAGRRRYEDIDVIVDTAWRWREAHPQGYGKQ